MQDIFVTQLNIQHVRHLRDISIPLSEQARKHLILTGKNGSGKTSVLEALCAHLDFAKKISEMQWNGGTLPPAAQDSMIQEWDGGCRFALNHRFSDLWREYKRGAFLLAYYRDDRRLQVEKYGNIEPVSLQAVYGLRESPAAKLGRYLASMKATQVFAKEAGNPERAKQLELRLEDFTEMLRTVYQQPKTRLEFDPESFQFRICVPDREPFGFHEMSMGYSAILSIVTDLVLRMEKQRETNPEMLRGYDVEGIVLVDEIDSHLHVELQREIMPILTSLFPRIQFIVTTHSPFILNSTPDAVIYDLENGTLVENGMTDLPYEGIVEGYFQADRLSEELRRRYERYVALTDKPTLTDAEQAEIRALEYDLDEVPDRLAMDFAEAYKRRKLDFHNRG